MQIVRTHKNQYRLYNKDGKAIGTFKSLTLAKKRKHDLEVINKE